MDANGRIALFFLRGRVDLRAAVTASPQDVDQSGGTDGTRAKLSSGDAKLLCFCFMKTTTWQPTAFQRELDTWFGGTSAADFVGARVLEVSVMPPDDKFGPRPHQALVKLECTEKQQLLIYMSSKKIQLCGAYPLVVFQTYAPSDMFGGRRCQRLM